MTNQTALPRSATASSRSFMHDHIGSNTTIAANTTTVASSEDSSPNGTLYYSLDTENEAKQTILSKRQTRHEEDSQEDPNVSLRRKQSRVDDFKKPVVVSPLIKPLKDSTIKSGSTTPTEQSKIDFILGEPNWDDNPHSFAFLQSLNPERYDNKYLLKKKSPTDNRAGYLIGRGPESDIM
jgi:hypothetical protein